MRMGEILKQIEADDRPAHDYDIEENPPRRLRITLRHVDFVSPLGALRAQQGKGDLELAPNSSEVWADWRQDLDRRISRTALRAEALLAESR